MKKSSKWITGAALGAGSFALILGSVGVAQAHNSEGGSSQGEGKRGGPQSSLIAAGTITQAQADAVKTAMQEAREAAKAAALAELVKDGTFTQAQADALAAVESRGGKGALIADGTVTRVQLQALRESMQAAHEATKTKVLQGLVADGTLTQSQSDALAEAIGQGGKGMKGQGMKGHGGKGMKGQGRNA
jgi:hypothetical protein